MENILLADCGSSKCDWTLTDTITGSMKRAQSQGFNATLATDGDVILALEEVADLLHAADIIKFYGAGCRNGEPCEKVERALKSFAPRAAISVESDLQAAIDAVCPSGQGIVSILGTGANCCRVADGRVTAAVRSAGFILGDEGSGAAMGRQLMGDYLGGRLPELLQRELEDNYGLTPDGVINRVYYEKRPNAFLGSFMPLIAGHIADCAYCRSLVENQILTFINHNIITLLDGGCTECHFIGSIAYHFADILRSKMASVSPVGHIIKSPMDILIKRALCES